MSRQPLQIPLPGFEAARARWENEYRRQTADAAQPLRNRSGVVIEPLYTPDHWGAERYMADLGFPGQPPMTRGIYPSMYRGRPWSQRQLIGLGTPEDYNARLRTILAAGATAISLIPCNSVYRGYDADEVDPLLLGTCGAVVNTIEDMDTCFRNVPLGQISTALNDPLPFTLLALLLAVAKRRGVPWGRITGTSNQSDYISHFVANHMFFRIALPGSRRVLVDHIEFANRHLPGWNPVSVVGQHMQQAGATPAQAMAFTLCTAIQYAEDCIARGLDPDAFLPRFTFFFDISISFFEEIAKLRAGRRIWPRIVRERLRARDPRSARFKLHAQTSGVDLTRQQPLNNIARTTAQAMAAIFGGAQSLHTDAYDEVLSVPTEEAARIAIATQNILREEAHLDAVIDPLGGSYYLETLTNHMEEEIESVIAQIDAAGGMYRAVESGLVQALIGESALVFQERVDRGEQTIVGVNVYRAEQEEEGVHRALLGRPEPARIEAQLERLRSYRAARSQASVRRALDALARAAGAADENVYEKVVEAAVAGATHGEIVARLRDEIGFGEPLLVP
ncbi:MAG: methylmalonyl-CoA mutase [Gammaproteobacteria bacterium]|nr:methylmalonyl-CoA mutase [Gammaproteobacteria bacterium]NIR83411.1 methylmalonyl-CoA mutase [Gammaproteobacteria bacterium]NIR91333.1 methylmalonyl-CoA mutase [Gammaproteobacteria bacterium]NIU04573.1 methylmalonyl-CoA mutase [Gammaproteobacteria bacterium]NIV51615.1 methylmalonyl-CoA mutase [Gammaproteobacteria bacterium]